jgi:hypothetical protein
MSAIFTGPQFLRLQKTAHPLSGMTKGKSNPLLGSHLSISLPLIFFSGQDRMKLSEKPRQKGKRPDREICLFI